MHNEPLNDWHRHSARYSRWAIKLCITSIACAFLGLAIQVIAIVVRLTTMPVCPVCPAATIDAGLIERAP